MNFGFRISDFGLKRLAALLLALALAPFGVLAQQQQQGLCAQVTIVISQQLTIERVGFLATLQITDNDSTDPITDFSANLTFENRALSTNGTANDSSSLFFVQPPTLQNITSVNGGGQIGPGATATISWFIIPTVTAGGTIPDGTRYQIGASLSGKLRGAEIPAATLKVFPAPITVKPDAQLQITYFQPRDVIGDDPFTPQVESPIPFTFGVIVKNSGYGTAHNVQINSQQPKITKNTDNLLLVAQLLGSRVNDSSLSNANLLVNLGDLAPGQAAKGAWDMITSLSGTFISINATYTHASELGGLETLVIQSLNAYLFAHEVIDDQPGRDGVKDFLADMTGALDSIGNQIPDTLYESEGYVLPVTFANNANVTGSGNPVQVNLSAANTGWTYARLIDPGQAKFPIASVVRSDGKVLNTNNYWTSIHFEPVSNIKDTYLNVFDLVTPGSYTYTVTYMNVAVDATPPVTTLQFAGAATFTNGIYYVVPGTQMYFLSQDASPVSIVYSLNGAAFQPAYPFNLPVPGQYQLVYYATDSSNNQETNHTATIVVAGSSTLAFANVTMPVDPLFDPGDTLSVRPVTVPITFQAAVNPTRMDAKVDIFQGAVGWANVAGAPSSPTTNRAASLVIGGSTVDYYIYSVNGAAWSSEQPVASHLNLSGLGNGSYTVAVLGRSQYGLYLDPTNAVSVGWVVDPSAPLTTIAGTPATPAVGASAQFTIGGPGVTTYRWTTNNDFYRAPTNVATLLAFSNLVNGTELLQVLGGGQSTNNPTTVTWKIDPFYGSDFSTLPVVRTVALTNIGSGVTTFNWDGRNNVGTLQGPGWYTVRITLTDTLGHTNFATGLAQVSELSGTNVVVAGAVRGPKNPYGRGPWLVWQDQSDGNWEIYAQNVRSNNAPIIKVTNIPLSQENPKTDGRYVVWQGRQTNGNWDIYIDDLTGVAGPQALTSTPSLNEINPVIDWPWVIYQARTTANATAPWQIYARNLINSQTVPVAPSTQDEIDPAVQAGRVVWQDFRDVGAGEIYFALLENNKLRRITTNSYGQYNPAIYNNWIVWADNRNLNLDIYGFDLLRNHEFQLTSTPEDETRPYVNGPWLVCLENSVGPNFGNTRLIHLPSLDAVSVTRTPTVKSLPALADGIVLWQETVSNQSQIMQVALPALQPVFQNQNLVAVGAALVSYAHNAYGLLSVWKTNGVQRIDYYPSLLTQVSPQTASLSGGVPTGTNFNLVAGSFLAVTFDKTRVLDLGLNNSTAVNLAAGGNVFGYTAFPSTYSAYQLLRQIGLNNAQSVRMLDSQSGLWLVAVVQNGKLAGNDFPIPSVAVLLVTVANPVNQFTPQLLP